MPEFTCGAPDCRETLRHEHRDYYYAITGDHHWYDLREADIRLLNEARAVHHLPLLIFGRTQTHAEQLIWGPESGIEPEPAPAPAPEESKDG
jgi:hypothetical protein